MVGVVILAAGSSSRLGEAKQLLQWQGKSLLQRAIDAASEVSEHVVVVLGARNEEISTLVEKNKVVIAVNQHWKDGMASSINTGLDVLLEREPALKSVIFIVCDQPHLDGSVLRRLIECAATGEKGIVASRYRGVDGTPVLFSERYFDDLRNLQGENGARKLIIKFEADVFSEPFEAGGVDIDTPEDWVQLNSQVP